MITTIDAVSFRIENSKLQVLFYRRPCEPFVDEYALPSTQMDEALDCCLEDALLRTFAHYKLPSPAFSEQVVTLGSHDRDPRGWSACVVYLCLFSAEQTQNELGWHWVDLEKVLSGEIQIAFDHFTLVEQAIKRIRMKSRYSMLPVHLLGEHFTLSELQQVFEMILGCPLNRAAFRRRINRAEILLETGQMRTGNQRPAALYSIKPDGADILFDQLMYGCAQ